MKKIVLGLFIIILTANFIIASAQGDFVDAIPNQQKDTISYKGIFLDTVSNFQVIFSSK